MRRPRPALVLLALSVIALLVGLVWSSLAMAPAPEVSVGARPSAAVGAAGPGAASPDPADLHDAREPGVAQPGHLAIPAIDVETRVVPVGLDESRGVAVPDDIRLVGWWKLGVPPGAGQGSAVLVGHRDGVEQGRGVFYGLGALTVGDRVIVTDDAGRPREFRVSAREYIRKRALPVEELFAVDGPPRLTLISCGGPYVRSQGGYQDNLVVTALPVAS